MNSSFNRNLTTVPPETRPTGEASAIAAVLLLIFLGSLAGNILVILAVRRDSTLRTPANFLICSLAFTDLLVAFLVMPFSALYEILGVWVFGDALCELWSAVDIACCTASILHLCAIALERHQSVTNAVRYFSEGGSHSVAPKIVIVWLLAICISIPPILGWRTSRSLPQSDNSSTVNQQCKVGHEPGYTVYATMGSFYIPLLVLLFFYIRIYMNIHSYVKRSQSRSRNLSVHSYDPSALRRRRSSASSGFRRFSSQVSINSRKISIVYHNMETRRPSRHWNSIIRKTVGEECEGKATNRGDEVMTRGHIVQWERSYKEELPIRLSTSDHLRLKRANRFHRQVAVDEGFESSPLPLSTKQSDDDLGEGNVLIAAGEWPLHARRMRRSYSEGDVSRAREPLPAHAIRPRTQTVGARVRFEARMTLSRWERPSADRRCTDEANNGVANLESRERSDSQLGRKWGRCPRRWGACCCPQVDKRRLKIRSSLRGGNSSPFLRYSLSVRAKIKMLKAREIRAIRTLGTIVGAFIFCWLPFFIVTITRPFCACVIPPEASSLVLWLGYCNSLVNPLLYAAFNREFHIAFKKLLVGRCCGR